MSWTSASRASTGPFGVSQGCVSEVRVSNPYRGAFISAQRFTPGKRTLYLADLYYYLFRDADFPFRAYGASGEEIATDGLTLLKEDTEYSGFTLQAYTGEGERNLDWQDRSAKVRFSNPTVSTFSAFSGQTDWEYSGAKIRKITFRLTDSRTGEAPGGVAKVRLYADQRAYAMGVPFFEGAPSGGAIDSFDIMEARRFIPVTFYGAGGQPLDARLTYIKAYYWSHYSGVRESCRFSYENSYDGECGAKNNLLQVELPDLRHTLETCESIGFSLAVGMEVPYSGVTYKAGPLKGQAEKPENVPALVKCLHFGSEEVPCEITSDGASQAIRVACATSLDDSSVRRVTCARRRQRVHAPHPPDPPVHLREGAERQRHKGRGHLLDHRGGRPADDPDGQEVQAYRRRHGQADALRQPEAVRGHRRGRQPGPVR